MPAVINLSAYRFAPLDGLPALKARFKAVADGAALKGTILLSSEGINLFVAGLRQGGIPGTGQIQRIVFNERWQALRREPMLTELKQRIRDVRQSPDGLLYVLTAEEDGALLRIEPR